MKKVKRHQKWMLVMPIKKIDPSSLKYLVELFSTERWIFVSNKRLPEYLETMCLLGMDCILCKYLEDK